MKKSKIMNGNKIIPVTFCIYTLLVPLIAFLMTCLYDMSGVTCTDACKVYPDSTYHLIKFSFLCICVLNIFLFIIAKKWLKNLEICIWAIILNCVFCLYAALLSIDGWYLILVIWPAIITIPIQFFLLGYIILKELILGILFPDYN